MHVSPVKFRGPVAPQAEPPAPQAIPPGATQFGAIFPGVLDGFWAVFGCIFKSGRARFSYFQKSDEKAPRRSMDLDLNIPPGQAAAMAMAMALLRAGVCRPRRAGAAPATANRLAAGVVPRFRSTWVAAARYTLVAAPALDRSTARTRSARRWTTRSGQPRAGARADAQRGGSASGARLYHSNTADLTGSNVPRWRHVGIAELRRWNCESEISSSTTPTTPL